MAMTVKELIKELEKQDPDNKVLIRGGGAPEKPDRVNPAHYKIDSGYGGFEPVTIIYTDRYRWI